MKLWIGMLCAVLLLAPGNRGKLLAQGEPDSHPAQEKANLPDGYQTAVFSAEKDFGEGRTVRASALVKCYAKGSFFSFEEVLATWTEKTGPGEYGFQEAYSHAAISEDRQTLQIQARGVVGNRRAGLHHGLLRLGGVAGCLIWEGTTTSGAGNRLLGQYLDQEMIRRKRQACATVPFPRAHFLDFDLPLQYQGEGLAVPA